MGTKAPLVETGAESPSEVDDLKRIAGIGPVIERHLHEAGVRSFAQLAALSPDQIATLLTQLPLISAERIVRQDWVGRARALARETAGQTASPGDGAAVGRHYATFSVELLLDDRRRVLRTRAAYVQGGDATSWEGWSLEQLARFFGAHTSGLEARDLPGAHPMSQVPPDRPLSPQPAEPAQPQPDPAAHADAAPARPAQLQLELGDLIVETVIDPAPGSAGLRAQLPFTLVGSDAAQLTADGAPYSVAILAGDSTSGALSLIGAFSGRLRRDQQRYDPIIGLVPPHEGRFQLLGTILIARAGLVKSVLGPLLHVIV